ncbi:MAG TPA: hypothetical protein VMM18_15350 [Gemmatimonadaceae bacterium]|nr:hypothetical protein [Gemmatimonadaceae bacterium]
MIRTTLVSLLAIVLLVGSTARGEAQETAVRFELAGIADSTFSFAIGRHEWVARGQQGIVVDPRRRDALVARFRVQRVDRGLATAVVTGQTTALSTQHAALLERPRPPFYRQPVFWIGVVAGGVLGLIAGS